MKKGIFILMSCLLTATSLFAQAAERRPMTVDDGMNMVRLENALMSPDGKRVFFSKSELDWGENKRKSSHYMTAVDGGEAIQFIG